MKEFLFILVMYLQNTKPRFQDNICLIIVFNHLGKSLDQNAWICYIGREVNSYYPIVLKQNYIPRHRSRAATKGKINWCEIVPSSKSMPPYKLKLVDDSSSDDGVEDDDKTKTVSNHDDDLEIESNVDSEIDKKEKGEEEMTKKTSTEIDVGNVSIAEKKKDVVEAEKEMEKEISSEKNSDKMESEKLDRHEVKIIHTEAMNQVQEIMEQDKVMETTLQNMELEACDEVNKETEDMPADDKTLEMDKATEKVTENMVFENVENKKQLRYIMKNQMRYLWLWKEVMEIKN